MPLPLLAAALGSGLVRGAIGLFQAKHNANVRKNLIGEAFRNSSEQLATRQRDVREGSEESLGARGMTGGGDATNTVAGQARANLGQQFGFETRDLDFQRRSELAGVKADYANQAIGSVTGAAETAASVYSSGSMIRGAFGLPANNGGLPASFSQAPSPSSVSNIGAPGTPNWDFKVPSPGGT